MRAIIIDPTTRSIIPTIIPRGRDRRLAAVPAAIGARSIAFATELASGDVMYVDDEGLLSEAPAFFAIAGAHQPFAGRGLLVGPECHGVMTDVISTIQEVRNLLNFDIEVDLNRLRGVRSVTFDSMEAAMEYLHRSRRASRTMLTNHPLVGESDESE